MKKEIKKNLLIVLIIPAFLCVHLPLIYAQDEIERSATSKRSNAIKFVKEKKEFNRKNVLLIVDKLNFPAKKPNNVPIGLVKKAVRMEASKDFEEFFLGVPIPCCDDNGMLLAYHVPVSIKGEGYSQILSPPSASEVVENLRNPSLWGASEFMTYVVSAREEDYPIPLYYQGLPPFLVTYHKAIEMAKIELANEDVLMKKYYCLGHRGDFFEIHSSTDEIILINAHTLQVEGRENVLIRSDEMLNLPSKAMSPKAQKTDKYSPEEHLELLNIQKEQTEKGWNKIKLNSTD